MSDLSIHTFHKYWQRQNWNTTDNILKLIDNYKKSVNYFNLVNINSPFTCFSGITKQSFSNRKIEKQGFIELLENVQVQQLDKSKKEELNSKGKRNSLYQKSSRLVPLEKKRIFKIEQNSKKRQNIFGIRQIKGVMFRERRKLIRNILQFQ